VLLGALTYGWIWADHYQPLIVGSTFGGDAGDGHVVELSRPGQVMTTYDFYAASTGTQFLVIRPKPRQAFWFKTELTATGRFPVTVTGISTQFDNNYFKTLVTKPYVSTFDSRKAGGIGDFTQFHRFVLDGTTRTGRGIKVVFTVPGCAKPDRTLPTNGDVAPYSDMSIATYRATYKFLWFTHTVDIPLQERIDVINLPMCPVK
jgi:hypothetical protein